MVQEGVDIIDLGAMSTRPGAKEVDLKQKLNYWRWPVNLFETHIRT